MHEMGLLKDILEKVDSVAATNGADHIVALEIWIGALAHISGDHFREHFEHATTGHVAEHARLDIVVSTDETDPKAQEIVVVSVEVPGS